MVKKVIAVTSLLSWEKVVQESETSEGRKQLRQPENIRALLRFLTDKSDAFRTNAAGIIYKLLTSDCRVELFDYPNLVERLVDGVADRSNLVKHNCLACVSHFAKSPELRLRLARQLNLISRLTDRLSDSNLTLISDSIFVFYHLLKDSQVLHNLSKDKRFVSVIENVNLDAFRRAKSVTSKDYRRIKEAYEDIRFRLRVAEPISKLERLKTQDSITWDAASDAIIEDIRVVLAAGLDEFEEHLKRIGVDFITHFASRSPRVRTKLLAAFGGVLHRHKIYSFRVLESLEMFNRIKASRFEAKHPGAPPGAGLISSDVMKDLYFVLRYGTLEQQRAAVSFIEYMATHSPSARQEMILNEDLRLSLRGCLKKPELREAADAAFSALMSKEGIGEAKVPIRLDCGARIRSRKIKDLLFCSDFFAVHTYYQLSHRWDNNSRTRGHLKSTLTKLYKYGITKDGFDPLIREMESLPSGLMGFEPIISVLKRYSPSMFNSSGEKIAKYERIKAILVRFQDLVLEEDQAFVTEAVRKVELKLWGFGK